MNRENESRSGEKNGGIRLNHLNILLICVGLILVVFMAVSMYRTTTSVKDVVSFTNSYLASQQTGGMLHEFDGNLADQAMAFVQSGEPGPAKAYEAQRDIINAQLDTYDSEASVSEASYEEFRKAEKAFRSRCEAQERAMRLVADTLPKPLFEALPAFLQERELSAEDQALSPEEKKTTAVALLTAEDYTALRTAIRESVDLSHRKSSEDGQAKANETFARVMGIVRNQTVLVLLLLCVAVAALLLNRLLILRPMQKSVDSLDRHQPIPEKGCYEMRHLARVYNDVLKDNEDKKEALAYTATHDPLTGVYNRAAFDKTYRKLEKQAHVGIVVVDVDHFKQYNDEFGHDIGDRVLCTAVEAMKRHFRSVDHISRIGGDEFCVIMPGSDYCQAEMICNKIRQINRELSENNGDLPPVTITAGIAFWDRPCPQGSLFKDADSALLEMKKTREDCCIVAGAQPEEEKTDA